MSILEHIQFPPGDEIVDVVTRKESIESLINSLLSTISIINQSRYQLALKEPLLLLIRQLQEEYVMLE